jgi:CheY-like chemotaxis protein
VWIRDEVKIVPLQDGAVEVVGTWTEVSDLRNAILQAQESDARFLRMTAQAPGMLVELALLEDGRPDFRFVSHGSYELIGLPPEDVKSRAESFLRMVDDDTKPLLYRQLVRSQQDFSDVDWQGTVHLPDGRKKRIRFQARPHSGEDPVVVWTGAFFEVALVERDERPVEPPVAVEAPVDEVPKEPLQGFEVVVIAPEDEAERLLAEGMGRWEGMTVTVATSGGLGLELAKRRRPAAIVAVEGLSDASANSLLEAIRADDDLGITPVIVFAERQGEGSRSRLLRAGADLVLDEAPTLKGLQEALSGVLVRV